MNKRVIIIGGGASGLFAAFTIKEQHRDIDVTILEAEDIVGKKILVTGNGRCNVANRDLSPEKFYCDDYGFIHRLIQNVPIELLEERFQKIGVILTDKNGYLYPQTLQAATIRNNLESACRLAGVNILCNTPARSFQKSDTGFCVYTDEKQYECEILLIACGTNASLKTDYPNGLIQSFASLDISCSDYKPALCSLYLNKKDKTMSDFLKKASGVRSNIQAHINGQSVSGELQITDYGLSGIVMFQLAHVVNVQREHGVKSEIIIDFLPEHTADSLVLFFRQEYGYEKKTLLDLFSQLLNQKLALALLQMYRSDTGAMTEPHHKNVSLDVLQDIIYYMKQVSFPIAKTNDALHSQVLSGGVDIHELSDEMEHKKTKNLYITGECVDVDGLCGGYNLYFAWATGYKAGRSIGNDSNITN